MGWKKETLVTGAKRVLITGANGFTGRHLVYEILKNTDWRIVTLERLSSHTADYPSRVIPFYHDFRAPLQDSLLAEIGHIDYIIHNGGEVHAPRSLAEPLKFVQSNAVGTFNMLEAARKLDVRRFIYVSSSEVFGESRTGESFSEDSSLNPGTPYAASKAAAESLCQAYFKSFRVPVNIVRPVNIFGQGQDEKKFIPSLAAKIKAGEEIPVHVSPEGVGSSRQWLHVSDYASALLFILESGNAGETYHVTGTELRIDDLISAVAHVLEPLKYHVRLTPAPIGAILQLRITGQKLRNLGWQPAEPFHARLRQTIEALQGTHDASHS